MASLIRIMLITVLFSLAYNFSGAQETDYLRHGKIFNFCSQKHVCAGCYTCENNRYEIKIRNNQDKKITAVRYKLYSSLYNHLETKEAKIEGSAINAQQTGILYICVSDIRHWYISEITYDDGTAATFGLHGGVNNFFQEPDECDCN
jgi:hypothetical protein